MNKKIKCIDLRKINLAQTPINILRKVVDTSTLNKETNNYDQSELEVVYDIVHGEVYVIQKYKTINLKEEEELLNQFEKRFTEIPYDNEMLYVLEKNITWDNIIQNIYDDNNSRNKAHRMDPIYNKYKRMGDITVGYTPYGELTIKIKSMGNEEFIIQYIDYQTLVLNKEINDIYLPRPIREWDKVDLERFTVSIPTLNISLDMRTWQYLLKCYNLNKKGTKPEEYDTEVRALSGNLLDFLVDLRVEALGEEFQNSEYRDLLKTEYRRRYYDIDLIEGAYEESMGYDNPSIHDPMLRYREYKVYELPITFIRLKHIYEKIEGTDIISWEDNRCVEVKDEKKTSFIDKFTGWSSEIYNRDLVCVTEIRGNSEYDGDDLDYIKLAYMDTEDKKGYKTKEEISILFKETVDELLGIDINIDVILSNMEEEISEVTI